MGAPLPNSKAAAVGKETVEITSGCGNPPGLGDIGADPAALKTALKEHQRHGLAWCRWREAGGQVVRGGMLADDMGLGKTLTMLGLIADGWERGDPAPTLVVILPCLLSYIVLASPRAAPVVLESGRVYIAH